MVTTSPEPVMNAVTTSDGYYKWPKGVNVQLTDHFSTNEFTCPCMSCFDQMIAIDLVNKLEAVRVGLGRPLKVTSGYRCHNHQLELAARGYETAIGISQHELGRASDIALVGATSEQFKQMLKLCEQQFMAIGEGLSFLHVDLRVDKPNRRWYYKGRK